MELGMQTSSAKTELQNAGSGPPLFDVDGPCGTGRRGLRQIHLTRTGCDMNTGVHRRIDIASSTLGELDQVSTHEVIPIYKDPYAYIYIYIYTKLVLIVLLYECEAVSTDDPQGGLLKARSTSYEMSSPQSWQPGLQ